MELNKEINDLIEEAKLFNSSKEEFKELTSEWYSSCDSCLDTGCVCDCVNTGCDCVCQTSSLNE